MESKVVVDVDGGVVLREAAVEGGTVVGVVVTRGVVVLVVVVIRSGGDKAVEVAKMEDAGQAVLSAVGRS